MASQAWTRFDQKSYDNTPEVLRSVGLIRLINGELPAQRLRPTSPIRQLRSRWVLPSSSARASRQQLDRRNNHGLRNGLSSRVANIDLLLGNNKLPTPEISITENTPKYTNGMMIWIQLLEKLWWPGVVVNKCPVDKLRHNYENIVTVFYTRYIVHVYKKSQIKPYDCEEKEDLVLLGRSTLSNREWGELKADDFEQALNAFDKAQRIISVQSTTIRTEYPAGSRVWFKLNDKFWWPGVVLHSNFRNPQTGRICKTHHVVFSGYELIHVMNCTEIKDYEDRNKIKYAEYTYRHFKKYGHAIDNSRYNMDAFEDIVSKYEGCLVGISDIFEYLEALYVIF